MKFLNCKIVKLSVFFGLFFLFGHTVSSQENKCIETNYLLFDDVFDKFIQRQGKSSAKINEELVFEISKNKAGFSLSFDMEERLKLAGANDLLIETIRKNLLPETAIEAIRLYRRFEANYESTNETGLKLAIDAANNFIAKFGNDECYKEQTEYFRKAVPLLEKILNKEDISVPIDPKIKYKYELLGQVEKAYRLKNWDEVFIIGERVLEIDPEFIDLILVLASVGFEQTRTESYKDKFNNETIRYAELAIKLLESGKELDTKNFGALDYKFKTYRFSDGRENALGWMYCYIGYVKYYRLQQKNKALSYYYKAIQYNSGVREVYDIYRIFGAFYYERLAEQDQKRLRLLEKNSEADVSKIVEETNALLERAIDAYARGYDILKRKPQIDEKKLKEFYDELQRLIKLRYGNESPYNFEKLISTINQKPIPDLLK